MPTWSHTQRAPQGNGGAAVALPEELWGVISSFIPGTAQGKETTPTTSIRALSTGHAATFIPAGCAHPLRSLVGWAAPFVVIGLPSEQQSEGLADDAVSLDLPAQQPSAHFFATVPHISVGNSKPPSCHYLRGAEGAAAVDARQVTVDESLLDMESMELGVARQVLSAVVQARSVCAHPQSPAVWVQTNSSETPYLGIEVRAAAKADDELRVAGTYSVQCSRQPVSARQKYGCSLVPQIDRLVAEYLAYCGGHNGMRVATHGRAVYDILGNGTVTEATALGGGSAANALSTVAVEMAWANVDKVLAPPAYASDCVVSVRAVPGDKRSAARALHEELLRLQAICDYVVGGNWPASATAEMGEDAVRLLAHRFVENPSATSRVLPAVSVPSQDADGAAMPASSSSLLPQRGDMDFSERLWRLAMCSATAAEACRVMRAVLRLVAIGSGMPTVHKSNRGAIADVVRKCIALARARGASTPAAIRESESALLAEIDALCGPGREREGVAALVACAFQKVAKDHVAVLSAHDELMSAAVLERLVPARAEHGYECDKALRSLWALHAVVELMITATSLAGIPQDTVRALGASAVDYYSEHGASVHPMFSVAMPAFSSQAAAVRQACASLLPASWAVTLASEAKADVMVAHYSVRTPFPHILKDDVMDTVVVDDNQPYNECKALYRSFC